jgi:hypothetical protein
MKSYQNVTDLIIGGQLNNGGNYSDYGIAFSSPWTAAGAFQSTTDACHGRKGMDFIGGAPPLVLASAKHTELKGLTKAYASNLTQRMSVGVSSDALFIITTGQGNKANLATLTEEGVFQGLTALINLDGGGSTSMVIGGQTVFLGRNIPSALVIKRRW